MIESLATVLILNELVIASPILDSHLLGTVIKGCLLLEPFFFFIHLYCILRREELLYGLDCHSDKPSSSSCY